MLKPTKLVGECSNISAGCRGFSSNKRQVGQVKNGLDVKSIDSFDRLLIRRITHAERCVRRTAFAARCDRALGKVGAVQGTHVRCHTAHSTQCLPVCWSEQTLACAEMSIRLGSN